MYSLWVIPSPWNKRCSSPSGIKPLSEMSVEDVSRLLISLELTNYCSVLEEYEVDGPTLMNCNTEDDVKELGILVTAKARLLLYEITKLKNLSEVSELL